MFLSSPSSPAPFIIISPHIRDEKTKTWRGLGTLPSYMQLGSIWAKTQTQSSGGRTLGLLSSSTCTCCSQRCSRTATVAASPAAPRSSLVIIIPIIITIFIVYYMLLVHQPVLNTVYINDPHLICKQEIKQVINISIFEMKTKWRGYEPARDHRAKIQPCSAWFQGLQIGILHFHSQEIPQPSCWPTALGISRTQEGSPPHLQSFPQASDQP